MQTRIERSLTLTITRTLEGRRRILELMRFWGELPTGKLGRRCPMPGCSAAFHPSSKLADEHGNGLVLLLSKSTIRDAHSGR